MPHGETEAHSEETHCGGVQVPEFEAECHIDLLETLQSLGLETTFDAASANFELLTTDPNFAVAEMSQKSKVDDFRLFSGKAHFRRAVCQQSVPAEQ